MKLLSITFIIAFTLLSFVNGEADNHKHRKGDKDPIKKYDTNGDGLLSLEEFSLSKKISHLSKEQVRAIFDRLDKNSDQFLDRNDLHFGKRHLRERHAELDTNNDKKISRDEFLANRASSELERHEKIFSMLDVNNDNFLSHEDRQGKFKHGKGFKAHIIEKNDSNGDGAVSFEEFKLSENRENLPESKLEEMFNHLDTNQDGKVDSNDLLRGSRAEH